MYKWISSNATGLQDVHAGKYQLSPCFQCVGIRHTIKSSTSFYSFSNWPLNLHLLWITGKAVGQDKSFITGWFCNTLGQGTTVRHYKDTKHEMVCLPKSSQLDSALLERRMDFFHQVRAFKAPKMLPVQKSLAMKNPWVPSSGKSEHICVSFPCCPF